MLSTIIGLVISIPIMIGVGLVLRAAIRGTIKDIQNQLRESGKPDG